MSRLVVAVSRLVATCRDAFLIFDTIISRYIAFAGTILRVHGRMRRPNGTL